MATLTVYSTSVTGSREIKSQQSEVTRILDGKNIKYNLVDISQDNALREEMRAKSVLANQTMRRDVIFPLQHLIGQRQGEVKMTLEASSSLEPSPVQAQIKDYELFVEAVEQNTLQEFLKLA